MTAEQNLKQDKLQLRQVLLARGQSPSCAEALKKCNGNCSTYETGSSAALTPLVCLTEGPPPRGPPGGRTCDLARGPKEKKEPRGPAAACRWKEGPAASRRSRYGDIRLNNSGSSGRRADNALTTSGSSAKAVDRSRYKKLAEALFLKRIK